MSYIYLLFQIYSSTKNKQNQNCNCATLPLLIRYLSEIPTSKHRERGSYVGSSHIKDSLPTSSKYYKSIGS